jgi:hypothetical protein
MLMKKKDKLKLFASRAKKYTPGAAGCSSLRKSITFDRLDIIDVKKKVSQKKVDNKKVRRAAAFVFKSFIILENLTTLLLFLLYNCATPTLPQSNSIFSAINLNSTI